MPGPGRSAGAGRDRVDQAVDPASADARTAVAAYLRELDETFEGGFDAPAGAADEEALGGQRGRFIVARSGGVAGCGGPKSLADDIGEIKRMPTTGSRRRSRLGT